MSDKPKCECRYMTKDLALVREFEQCPLCKVAPELYEACTAMLIAIHSIKHVLEFTHEDTTKEFTDGWKAVELAIAHAEARRAE